MADMLNNASIRFGSVAQGTTIPWYVVKQTLPDGTIRRLAIEKFPKPIVVTQATNLVIVSARTLRGRMLDGRNPRGLSRAFLDAILAQSANVVRVSLHTDDPGVDGDGNEVPDTGYSAQNVTMITTD